MLKGYKYRLHPTAAQAEFLVRTIGCARFVYNKLLEDRITIH
ncbi:transposase, partial [Exiguobacterium sp. SH4S7]